MLTSFIDSLIVEDSLIKCIPFTESLSEEWDIFVNERAVNSTFLHSRKFYDHNPLNKAQDGSLLFLRKDKIIAVFPAVIYYKNGRMILNSHLRATYGGVVVSKDVNVQASIKIIKYIIQYAERKMVKTIIIRNPFRIFNVQLCDEVDYAMWYNGFNIKSRELEMVISLNRESEVTKSRYHKDVSRNVKKGLKNLEVSELSNLREFWALLEECILEKHGKTPVHDLKSINRLIESVGSEKVLCFGAYYKLKLIGGCVLFVANNLVLHGQYIGAIRDYQYLKPNHALIDHVIEYGCNKGFRYLNLGMANEDDGKLINDGLFSLKEHFGAKGVLRETMVFNIAS
jgi:hypothetical protein